MPSMYKSYPAWRNKVVDLVKRGHPLKVVSATMQVGMDRILAEKRRDPDWGDELDQAIQTGKENPHKPRPGSL